MNKYKFYQLLESALLTPIVTLPLIILGKTPAQANVDRTLYLAQTPDLPPVTNIDNLPRVPLPDTQKDPAITPLPPVENFLDSLPNQLATSREFFRFATQPVARRESSKI